MKIKFYAHASFRLEGDGLAIVTDPFNCRISTRSTNPPTLF